MNINNETLRERKQLVNRMKQLKYRTNRTEVEETKPDLR